MPADALALARSILDASAQASAAGCPTSPREVWRLGCPDRLDVLVALEQLAAPSPAVEAHLAAASREVDAWVRERYRGGAGGCWGGRRGRWGLCGGVTPRGGREEARRVGERDGLCGGDGMGG